MNNQERIELLDRLGLCHKCEKARPAPNRKFCFDCLIKIQEINAARYDPEKAKAYQARRRELYREHKSKGICIRCRKKATYGMYCYTHFLEAKRRSSESAAKRKNERADRGLIPDYRRANGLCLRCGDPIDGTGNSMCSRCCEKQREYGLKADKTYWRRSMRFAGGGSK